MSKTERKLIRRRATMYVPYWRKKEAGLASIPTVLVIGLLVVAVATSVASVAFVEQLISAGESRSAQALVFAQTGAQDALQRLVRESTYTTSPCTADCYTIDMVTNGCSSGDACALVAVSAGVGSSGDPKQITATGQSGGVKRTVRVDVVYDTSLNGQIQTATWTELTN